MKKVFLTLLFALSTFNSLYGQEIPSAAEILQKIDQALSKQLVDYQWTLPIQTREFDHNAKNYAELRIACGNILSQLIPIIEV